MLVLLGRWPSSEVFDWYVGWQNSRDIELIYFCCLQCTKFTNASRVPKSFIRKNMELRGQLREINHDGTLQVEHLPVLRMPWHRSDQCLSLRLAYTNPTISGTYWMKLNHNNQPIRFTLFDRNVQRNELVALVRSKVLKQSLNETLILKGLATLNKSSAATSLNKKQAALLKSLEKCEAKAKKEGEGMWEAYRKPTLMSNTVDAFKRMIAKLSSK